MRPYSSPLRTHTIDVFFKIRKFGGWAVNCTLQYYQLYFKDEEIQLFIRSVMSDSLRAHGLPHTRLLCPSLSSGVCSNASLLSWCHPPILSSVVPFSSCLQSFPASGSFPVNQLFTSGGQRIGASASASFLQMNIQDWFPLGLTGWISLQSKGFSRVLQHHSSILQWAAFIMV